MKIAVFSDIHIPAKFSAHTLFDKRILGYCNSSIIRSGYRMDRIAAGVKTILDASPDLILFCGDAASSADPREFQEAKRQLQPLIDSRIPILYTTGNHDRYVPADDCFRAWQEFRRELTAAAPMSMPGLYETSELRFAVFDFAKPCSPWLSCGFVHDNDISFLQGLLDSDDPRPIVMLTHFPCFIGNGPTLFERRHGLKGYERLKRLAESPRIRLIVCGHQHAPEETFTSTGSCEIVTGALTKHNILRFISYESNRFTITSCDCNGRKLRPAISF